MSDAQANYELKIKNENTILMQLIGNGKGKLGNYGLSCAHAHLYFC